MTPAALAARRQRWLAAVAAGLMLAGVALAVLRPAWLTEPLQAAVQGAGAAAPAVFVALCALAAPLHLNGVLVAMSAVIWPLPTALGLSFAGSLLGCFLTAWLLRRAGGSALRQRETWPGWLRRLAGEVARRPVLVGLAARVALGSGLALEAFYLVTGYTRRQYLLLTVVGVAVWVAQALLGVTLLRAALEISAGLAVLAALAPLLVVAAFGRRRFRS